MTFVHEFKAAFRNPESAAALWTRERSRIVAATEIPAGARIAVVGEDALHFSQPTEGTRQIDLRAHVLDGFLSQLRHGCRPTAHFVADERAVYSARKVLAGEELTIFYPSSDWELASPFDCACGSADCLGRISGAYAVPIETLKRYYLNPIVTGLALGLKPHTD